MYLGKREIKYEDGSGVFETCFYKLTEAEKKLVGMHAVYNLKDGAITLRATFGTGMGYSRRHAKRVIESKEKRMLKILNHDDIIIARMIVGLEKKLDDLKEAWGRENRYGCSLSDRMNFLELTVDALKEAWDKQRRKK